MSLSKLLTPALASGLLILLAAPAAHAQTAATVDGSKITNSVLEAYIEGRTGQPAAAATPQQRSDFLTQLTDLYILSNVAKKKGLDKQEDIVTAMELQRRSLMTQALIQDYITSNPATEEQMRAEYDKQIGSVAKPTQYKARHILVATPEEAAAVITQLDKGADFATLAKEKSTGPSGPQGGDLGWFSADTMVPPFSAGVQALKNGEYTRTAVQTQFGYHVILREDTKELEAPAFEEVKDRLKQAMDQQSFQTYLETLRSKAKVKVGAE